MRDDEVVVEIVRVARRVAQPVEARDRSEAPAERGEPGGAAPLVLAVVAVDVLAGAA